MSRLLNLLALLALLLLAAAPASGVMVPIEKNAVPVFEGGDVGTAVATGDTTAIMEMVTDQALDRAMSGKKKAGNSPGPKSPKQSNAEAEAAAKETGKTHVTYTKPGPNGETYSGRTSGPSTMTPEEIVARRDAGHHMNDKDFGPAVLDKSSSNGSAIRGREQQLIDANGGAQSKGGTSGNAINGISPTNKKGSHYRSEADREFGGGS